MTSYIEQLERDNELLREQLEQSRTSEDLTKSLLEEATTSTHFFSIHWNINASHQEFFYKTQEHAAFHLHECIHTAGDLLTNDPDMVERFAIWVFFHYLIDPYKPCNPLIPPSLNNTYFPAILKIWKGPKDPKIEYELTSTCIAVECYKGGRNKEFHFNLIEKELEYLKETSKKLQRNLQRSSGEAISSYE